MITDYFERRWLPFARGGDGGDGGGDGGDGVSMDTAGGPAQTGDPNTSDPGPGPVDTSGAYGAADPNDPFGPDPGNLDFNSISGPNPMSDFSGNPMSNQGDFLTGGTSPFDADAFTGNPAPSELNSPSSTVANAFNDLSMSNPASNPSFADEFDTSNVTSVGGPPASETFTGNTGGPVNDGGPVSGGPPGSGPNATTGGPINSVLDTSAQPSPTDVNHMGPGNITFSNTGGPTGSTGGNLTGNFGGGGDTGGLSLGGQAIPSTGFGMGGGGIGSTTGVGGNMVVNTAPRQSDGSGMPFDPNNPNWQGNPNWAQSFGSGNPAAGGNLGAVLSALGGAGGTGGFGGGR